MAIDYAALLTDEQKRGIPSAYVKGITNGRKQVMEILRQFETTKEGLN